MKQMFETKALRGLAFILALVLAVTAFEGCSSGKKGAKIQSSGKMSGAKR